MEDKLHNDGLEDFLKKSFEQYDDSPSDGLWDKIESDLDVQPVIVPISRNWRWWASAAAIFLLAIMVGQHFYYGQKIGQLTQRIEKADKEMESLETENGELKEALQAAIPKPERQETLLLEEETPAVANQVENSLNPANNAPPPRIPEIILAKSNNNQASENKALSENTSPISDPQINDFIKDREDTAIADSPVQFHITPDQLDYLNIKELDISTTAPSSLNVPAITPNSQGQRFSIGVHRTEMATNERISRTIQRPNPMNDRRIFSGRMTNRGNTQITGISAAMDLKKGWFVESGINLRKTTFEINHNVQLQFKDRRNPPVNPPGGDYRFEYALSTASGLMEIDVRASQTDMGQVIGEEEDIKIEVNTEHNIKYVSLPLLLGHRFGFGRLKLEVQAGLMANFLTNNSFSITKVTIDHPRLHGSNTAKPKGIAPNLKQSTVDFMATTGLSYELGGGWSASLTPTLLVSSSSRHFDQYVQSKSVSTGIEFGLNYRF